MNEEDQKKEPVIIEELPKAETTAETFQRITNEYMETVVKEMDLDRAAFYDGVAQGIDMIMKITAGLLTGKKP